MVMSVQLADYTPECISHAVNAIASISAQGLALGKLGINASLWCFLHCPANNAHRPGTGSHAASSLLSLSLFQSSPKNVLFLFLN